MRQLQVLLNARLHPSLGLTENGVFDEFTLEAVLRFQYRRGLPTIGVVGPRTWAQLLLCEFGECSSEPISPGAATPQQAPPAQRRAVGAPRAPVSQWSLGQRFGEVLARTVPQLPSELQGQLLAMLTPEGLATLTTTLAAFAAAQFFGVGELADIGLILYLGNEVAEDILDAITATVEAQSHADLDAAAGHLAHAIVLVGSALLLMRLARGLRGAGGAGAAAEAAESAASGEAESVPARPSSSGRSTTAPESAEPAPEPAEPEPAERLPPRTPTPPADPTVPPGEGWQWRGQEPVGGDRGAWYNPETGESLHPDLNHPEPIGPHWDYRASDRSFWRIFPDGRVEPN